MKSIKKIAALCLILFFSALSFAETETISVENSRLNINVFTLKNGLYENALKKQGITAIIPSNRDQEIIGNLIYPNLENGIIIPNDKRKLVEIAEKYISEEKADSLLLGCTELPLAINAGDVSVPILNTTEIHINEIYRSASEM